jgi:hypothetical protein
MKDFFRIKFYEGMARFSFWFGLIWIVSVTTALVIFSTNKEDINLINLGTNALSLFYLGNIFLGFRKEMLSKTRETEEQNLKNRVKYTIFKLVDIAVIILLSIPTIKNTFANNYITVEMFISYSTIFLGVFFSIFRIILNVLG